MEDVSASSVVVSIDGVDGNPDLILYKATAEGAGRKFECRVTRETVPLRCKLTGLQVVTRYTISVRSCLLGDRCGDALTQQVATKPHGKCEHGFEAAFKFICLNMPCFFHSTAKC